MMRRIMFPICKDMKSKKLKMVISIALVVAASCNEPETIVTNIVHPDGSVTRKIEMRNFSGDKFELTDMQVPFDSTWIIRDSLEFTEDGDTIWVKRAEKIFAGVEEINRIYATDSGANKSVGRHAEFRKKFKWFSTEYRFSEIVDKKMQHGYPVEDYLNDEELQWFYLPDNVTGERKNGPDSLKYRAYADTIDSKIEKWYLHSLVSEWIGEFSVLTAGKTSGEMNPDSLRAREEILVGLIETNIEQFDSLWQEGSFLREFLGEENSVRYRVEADSAAEIAADHFWVSFRNYTVRTIMPGKLTETNGFPDSSGTLLWPVKSDYFLTRPYEMKAVSKSSNLWAWIVSGWFLLCVVTGLALKRKG
jgi:hypothetical protein